MTFPLVRRWRFLWLAILSLVMIVTFATSTPAELSRSFSTEELHPYQLQNLNPCDERALGAAIDTYLKQDGLILYSTDPAVSTYIDQVGKRLTNSLDSRLQFIFQVVEDNNPNAFATVGGYVYINTGLLKAIQTEAELAGVIAHEMGHLQQRDGLNQLWLQLTVDQLAGFESGFQQRLIAWGGRLRSLSNRHEDELTADAIAFHLLGEAGYNQEGLLTLLQRISNASLTRPATFNLVSTHPTSQRRLRELQHLWSTEDPTDSSYGQSLEPYQTRMESLLNSNPTL